NLLLEGLEGRVGAHIGSRQRAALGMKTRAVVGSALRPRVTELHNEVSFEIRQAERTEMGVHAVRVIAGDLAAIGADLDQADDLWTSRLYQNAGTSIGGKGKAQISTVVGRGDLGLELA